MVWGRWLVDEQEGLAKRVGIGKKAASNVGIEGNVYIQGGDSGA